MRLRSFHKPAEIQPGTRERMGDRSVESIGDFRFRSGIDSGSL